MSHSAVITKPKRNVFAVLDMGSTKMICFAVKVNGNFTAQIIGVGYKVAEGINGGAITDMKRASSSILSVIDIAEQVSGETLDQVYINVAGCNVISSNIINEISSLVHEISERDIKRIMLQTHEKFGENDVILHNIPIKYRLDDIDNITELRGLYGGKLKADMHVIIASGPALFNIEHCISSCNLNMAGCIVESYASGIACLTEDEKELGTIVIDMGGRHTSIGIFNKGKFIYADSIPIGGMHITRDIAYGLCVGIEDAERIKVLYGNVILTSADENGVIELSDDERDDNVTILRSDLVNIIRPRVEEILELVKEKLALQKNITGKVVITGGGCKLASMREITGYILDRQVRIGCPINISGVGGDYSRNPIFSSAIGTTLLVTETFYKNSENYIEKENGFRKFLNWAKLKA